VFPEYLTPCFIHLTVFTIGGEKAFGWGPQDDADTIAALERGINWIETAV
jgi:hypothetical protein